MLEIFKKSCMDKKFFLEKVLKYSQRRYYIDTFYAEKISGLPSESRVLDIGGNRILKRGMFDIEQYSLRVCYANIITDKKPHVQADGAALPFRSASFEAVICAELIEHIISPEKVLDEAYRVLVKDGRLLMTVPFMFRIHADPHDFVRYTDTGLRRLLEKAGFVSISIEKQGLFWSVAFEMARELIVNSIKEDGLSGRFCKKACASLMTGLRRSIITFDANPDRVNHYFWGSFTLGFGITAYKQG